MESETPSWPGLVVTTHGRAADDSSSTASVAGVSDVRFTGEFMVPTDTERRLVRDHEERYRWAGQYVAGRRVLDIACGTGYGARMLALGGARYVIGADVSLEALRFAKANYVVPGVRFVEADICTYDGDGEPFDTITCFETIEHIPDYKAALANLRSLVAADGVLLISSPNRPVTSAHSRSLTDPPANPHHVREFVPGELSAALCEAAFVVDETVYGQRLEPRLPNRIMRAAYRRLVRPQVHSSPCVRPAGAAVPRYFLLVARPG